MLNYSPIQPFKGKVQFNSAILLNKCIPTNTAGVVWMECGACSDVFHIALLGVRVEFLLYHSLLLGQVTWSPVFDMEALSRLIKIMHGNLYTQRT